jgi:hypothetical protein
MGARSRPSRRQFVAAGVAGAAASAVLVRRRLRAADIDPFAPVEGRDIGPDSHFPVDASRYQTVTPPSLPRKGAGGLGRRSYLEFIPAESSYGIRAITNNPDRGVYGVRHATPALAQYDAKPEASAAEAIKRCLHFYETAVRAIVDKKGWHEQYMFDPTLLCLHRKVIAGHGHWSSEDESWFREFYLWMCRTVHVWGNVDSFWRGPMHRATGEAIMRLLALHLYPDIPEAAEWTRYTGLQWNDWWSFRDNPINDINYFHGMIFPLVVGAYLMGRTEVFTDSGMRRFWDRLIEMTTPDGAVVPFGPSWGWNSHAGERMMALEFAATYTRDGRYRFVAHRLFNYLQLQRDVVLSHHILDHFSQLGSALAYFVIDDSIAPKSPSAASAVLYHKETLRVQDKRGAQPYLADVDPDPHKAHIDCGLLCTHKTMPFKLCLRSGWQAGDMYMLVDLFPRHEPMNVTGVLGLTRWGSATTCSYSNKDVTNWLNMLRVEDVTGKAPRIRNRDPLLADKYYQTVQVSEFRDHPIATYAAVLVDDYNGFPMSLRREFFFIKNRFVLIRDTAVAQTEFVARIGPGWDTQFVGPQVGACWANTYVQAPITNEHKLHNPPVDLLICHAPKPDRRLQLVDASSDPRRETTPFTLRYVWEGALRPGVEHCFSHLLLPTIPVHPDAPAASSLSGENENIMRNGPVRGISALIDTPEQTVWRIRSETDREEWIVVGARRPSVHARPDAVLPTRLAVDAPPLHTDARLAYVELRAGKIRRSWYVGGSYLRIRPA